MHPCKLRYNIISVNYVRIYISGYKCGDGLPVAGSDVDARPEAEPLAGISYII